MDVNRIVARTFADDISMLAWLASDSAMRELKAQYPPQTYTAFVDVVKREVIVKRREDAV